MKQPEDTKTIDMLAPAKRGRGRPATGCAMTDAERAKKYREKKASLGWGAGLRGRDNSYAEWQRLVQENNDLKHQVESLSSPLGMSFTEMSQEISELRRQIEDLKFQLKGANALLGDYQRDLLPPSQPAGKRKAGSLLAEFVQEHRMQTRGKRKA